MSKKKKYSQDEILKQLNFRVRKTDYLLFRKKCKQLKISMTGVLVDFIVKVIGE